MLVSPEKARHLENALFLVREMESMSSEISRLVREKYNESTNLIKLMKDIQVSEVISRFELLTTINVNGKSSKTQSDNLKNESYYSSQSLLLEKHQYEKRIQEIENRKAQLIKRTDEIAQEIRDVWIAITCDNSF